MRIITFDFDKGESDSVASRPFEMALRELVAATSDLESARWRRLLELVEHLESSRLGFDVVAQVIDDGVLMVHYPWPKRMVRIIVKVDWQDYAPLRNGLPEMHYRFQIKHPETVGCTTASKSSIPRPLYRKTLARKT